MELLNHVNFSEFNYGLDGTVSACWLPDDGLLQVEFIDRAGNGESRLYRLEEVDQ